MGSFLRSQFQFITGLRESLLCLLAVGNLVLQAFICAKNFLQTHRPSGHADHETMRLPTPKLMVLEAAGQINDSFRDRVIPNRLPKGQIAGGNPLENS